VTKARADESLDAERAKAKSTAAGQTYQGYTAPKPTKIYQRTVTSVERPLSAFVERRSAQPPVQVKSTPAIVPTTQQAPVKATPARVVMDNYQDNYFDRSHQIKQFSSQPTPNSFLRQS
jgi:hypothetical protein